MLRRFGCIQIFLKLHRRNINVSSDINNSSLHHTSRPMSIEYYKMTVPPAITHKINTECTNAKENFLKSELMSTRYGCQRSKACRLRPHNS